MLHADDAERAAVRAKRSDHGLARGRVGPALHLAGEQHRPAGLGDRSGDAFTDPLPVELRGIRESARASHRELALRVREHDRDAIRAEDVRELCRRALEQLVGIALLADDRLEVTRCFELRFGVLPLPLRAPERVRLRELEADEIADTAETREILGREGPTGEHRGETPDDLILPDDRRHREGVGEAAV